MAGMNKKPGQQPLQTSQTSAPANTHVDAKLDILTIHVFFDGTRNNRFNTAAARENPKLKSKDISYANYYSNIALLFLGMKTSPTVKSVYIEGSGSAQGKTDDMPGLGLAAGPTGRTIRIVSAFRQINNIAGKKDRSLIVLNVYGFSRGAAWARHFCHLLKSTPYSEWRKAKINFVGIFDTVSSDDADHYNDVKEMGLDIGKPQGINYIAHLTAQNDYREHFPLTRIRGALKDGIGFECSFPGAHSDIGGGYPETYLEKDTDLGKANVVATEQSKEYIDSQWFLKMGYYTPEQISTTEKKSFPYTSSQTHLVANRKTYYFYQFILGDIMYEIAKKKAGYIASEKAEYFDGIRRMKTIDVLKRFHQGARSYVLQHYLTKGGGYQVPLLGEKDMKIIYNHFIHNSLQYGDIANQGTILSKTKKSDNSYDYSRPVRPEVTKGFR